MARRHKKHRAKPRGAIGDALRAIGRGGIRPTWEVRGQLRALDNPQFAGAFDALWPTIRTALNTVDSGLGLGEAPPRLTEVDPDEAALLVAFLQVQTLAYGSRIGQERPAVEAAEALFQAMGRVRAWVDTDLYTLIDADTLRLPRGGYSFASNPLLGNATMEASVLLLSPTAVLLLSWEDED